MKQSMISRGVWPAMLTPFNEDKSIDWYGVDALIEWYIEGGVAGLFAVGQSSEMFALDDDERLSLAAHVVKRAADRVPVVATGTFATDVEAQAEFVQRMADTGIQAVTVITSQLASRAEDDACLRQRLEKLMQLTAEIPLALYECPQPYHRILTAEFVGWAAQSNRFHLLKETSRSLQLVQQKVLAAAGTSMQVFNADTSALLSSLRAGASGYCGIAANFYPDLVAWLCDNFEAFPSQAEAIQSLLAALDPAIHTKYPVCAKYFHQQIGNTILTVSRATNATLDDYDRRVFDGIVAKAAEQRRLMV
ncbi:MAG: dihydrodipicolinate synthase family protein [Chloroflexi bacterium]|nr:dihydrodipicolinate synthase family protein [Chloroflexota bacterium]